MVSFHGDLTFCLFHQVGNPESRGLNFKCDYCIFFSSFRSKY